MTDKAEEDWSKGNTEVGESGEKAFKATPEWVESWKSKLPLQTIMRLLQVLVPQVEKICIDKLGFFVYFLNLSYYFQI